MSTRQRHFLTTRDLYPRFDAESLVSLLDAGQAFKAGRRSTDVLAGKHAVMLFEKPSLRTKLSFSVGVAKLGGSVSYFGANEVGLGKREAVADVASVVSRMADLVIIRTFAQSLLEEFAEHSRVPVINALSDFEHPCQAMADLLTIREVKPGLTKPRIVYVGDFNNVALSLAWAVTELYRCPMVLTTPNSGKLPAEMVAGLEERLTVVSDPREAVRDADVVYSDVWVSMGEEEQARQKLADFAGYQVNPELMSYAKSDAVFMHPLPAHYGDEVSAEMFADSRSVYFQQAENRLWAQMAVIDRIFSNDNES